ncbi:hypothetical protein GC163_17275 [bacterium]|nr:hypothetical protein [bacterium]
MAVSSGQYRFRKHDTIGAMDADDDSFFLDHCFIDTGDLDKLCDLTLPFCIILGRTGSGKSALLRQLRMRSESHDAIVVSQRPEDLSFNYLCNSHILRHLTELQVNLDPFFKLLWKHVFAVSIFQSRFNLIDESAQRSWLMQLFESQETKHKRRQEEASKKKAVDYVQRWGNMFWESSDIRVKEVVSHFEDEISSKITGGLEGRVGVSLAGNESAVKSSVSADASSREKTQTTISSESVEHARRIIHDIQVKELTGILELVNEVLPDRQKPCFIVIDQLDEAWAEDSLRIRLMKALLDTVREFRTVRHAKIVLCLRIDLLERLFREMRDEVGFQEEKYRSLYLPLSWSPRQLEHLLDARIQKLVKDQYTTYQPTARDILPKSMGKHIKGDGLDYIIERTWMRPRDVIDFLNICIRKSEGKAQIDKTTLLAAEGEYSRSRFKSIGSEWEHLYPGLLDLAHVLLSNRKSAFTLSEISDETIWIWAEQECSKETPTAGLLADWAKDVVNSDGYDVLRQKAASLFYKTGIVGLQPSGNQRLHWSDNSSLNVSQSEINNESKLSIHPALRRVLGTVV